MSSQMSAFVYNVIPVENWDSSRIRALRKQLALSQERFADEVGVSVRTINRWERGKVSPNSLAVIQRLEHLEEQSRKTESKQ